MADSVIRKAAELPPDAQQVVAGLLGRSLDPDETVRIIASKPAPAEDKARAEAWNRLTESMDKISASMAHIPEDELNALIDEACDYVRHHPE